MAALSSEETRKAYDRSLEPASGVFPVAEIKLGRAPRTSRLPGSAYLFISIAAVVSTYFIFARTPADSATRIKPKAPATATPIAALPVEVPSISTPIETFVPMLPPTTAKPTTPTDQPKFVRPPKKPGFDAFHTAWSVYLVVGAKGRGSGVMLEKDKLLTNCHVISGSYEPRSVMVINSVTGERFYPEKVASLGEPDDVCLLDVPGAPEYLAEWGSSRSLAVEAPTHTVSFPGDRGLTWTSGALVKRETIKGIGMVLTTNHCPPGVSGGPLFDTDGRVIGITTGGRRYKMRTGETLQGECISVESELAREVMSHVTIPIAYAPFNYQGALGGGK